MLAPRTSRQNNRRADATGKCGHKLVFCPCVLKQGPNKAQTLQGQNPSNCPSAFASACRIALLRSALKMTETSEKTSKPASGNGGGENIAAGGGGNVTGGSAGSPPPYAGYPANPPAHPVFNQPPPGLGPPVGDPRQYYAQYPPPHAPYQYYHPSYHHPYPAGQVNSEPPPLSPYLAYQHPHGHVVRDRTPSGGYPQLPGYQQPQVHVGRDRTPSGGPPIQQSFPPFPVGPPHQQGPYYSAPGQHQSPPPPPNQHQPPLATHEQQQQSEEKPQPKQEPLPPPPAPPQESKRPLTPPPPPAMTYSLRKTITPRKGDESVETQRLRKLREIRMSGAEPSEPQQSEQSDPQRSEPQQSEPRQSEPRQSEPRQSEPRQSEPQQVQVASEQYELDSLMELPEDMLLSFALDAGTLDASPRSDTLRSPSPLTGPATAPKDAPAPATRATEMPSAPQKITKADLKAFGIPPPSRLAPPTSTPHKKSAKTHSRANSAVPPSNLQPRTPKRAASAQPAAPATGEEAFKQMGTLHPGSPLRAAERIVGINVDGDPDAEGASSGHFKVGGLTKEERDFVQKTAEEIVAKLNDASRSIERPVDLFLTFLNKLLSNKVTYTRSLWNYYTSYFWHHAEEERERIGNPEATPSDAFPSFQEAYPHWQELVVMEFQRSAVATVETIGERERQFDKWFSELVTRASRGEEMWGFQFFIGACGESVNEDQSLGCLHLSKNLGTGFMQERLMMTDDALIGQMKTHSYDYVSREYSRRLAEERDCAKDHDQNQNASGISSDESEVENTRRTNLLKRVRKLGDSALTKRLHELLAMSDESINRTNTDVGRKIVRDYLQALIRAEGGRADNVNLPWRELGTKLASQGLSVVGWAHKVPFPNKNSKPDGIKSAGVEGIRKIIFGLRDSTIHLERKEAGKLQNSKTPVAVEEAPPPDSEQTAGARYFLDGTMDLRGPVRRGSAPAASASRAKDATTAVKTKARARSVTFNEPPSKPATRSSKPANKGKGKQKAVILSDSDSDSDDDLPLAPPPPPPAASKKRSAGDRARTPPPPPPPAASKKRTADGVQVERIPVKVGNVEVPIPFVDNSEDDLYSPSPVRPSSKRPRPIASPVNESDECESPTKQVPQGPVPTTKSAGTQRVMPRPRKMRKGQDDESASAPPQSSPAPDLKSSSAASLQSAALPQSSSTLGPATAPLQPPPPPPPQSSSISGPATTLLQPPPLPPPPPGPTSANAPPPHYYHPFYQQQQPFPGNAPPHHYQLFHDASGLGAGGQHFQGGWAPGQPGDSSRG
ncbi:hypothetical protein MD484_g5590, partial [Candolleomyces efflorescens]